MDLFGKWSAGKSAVRCEGRFSKVAFSLTGRISSVNDDELRIIYDETRSEVVVRFSPEIEFEYADSRVVTGAAKKYGSCLVMIFSPVPEEGEPDTIAVGVSEQ